MTFALQQGRVHENTFKMSKIDQSTGGKARTQRASKLLNRAPNLQRYTEYYRTQHKRSATTAQQQWIQNENL